MIILRSTHKEALLAKDALIEQLRDEVAFLRSFIKPTEGRASRVVSTEANAILDSAQNQIEMAPDGLTPDDLRERDRILSGNY